MFARPAAFGANTIGRPGSGKGIATGRHHARVSGAPEVMGELPITCLAEEIETAGPGQVRALITIATNPVLSSPNGPRLARALASLDFMVSLDIYLNETTRLPRAGRTHETRPCRARPLPWQDQKGQTTAA